METRSAPRANIDIAAVIRIEGDEEQRFALSVGNQFEVKLTGISITGVSLFSEYLLPKGLKVELEMEGRLFGMSDPLIIKGEVRYCKQMEPSKYKCGVKFTQLSEYYRQKISVFVASGQRS